MRHAYLSSASTIAKLLGKPIIPPYRLKYRAHVAWNVPSALLAFSLTCLRSPVTKHQSIGYLDSKQCLQSPFHFARSLIRKGDGGDLVGTKSMMLDEVGDAGSQDTGLARAWTGEYLQR